MKTIIHVVGNRPQFIKLAVLYKELATNKFFNQVIVHTGQHFSYNMSDIFFEELSIPSPSINLNIQNNSPHLFIGEAANSLYDFFCSYKDAAVLVYGDTNTTLAAAMAAKRVGNKLIHFEAGVRTYDNQMPEETNRILTDRLADVNYCCTAHNYNTMLKEGYGTDIKSELLHTGDLMLDAFLQINEHQEKMHDEKYVICTIHREANLSSRENLSNIIEALNELHKNIEVKMPMHPHTQKKILEYGLSTSLNILPALGYHEMKHLLANSDYVITDSGGTSREAYFLQKKSLIVMNEPFWPEIITDQCSLSSTANKNSILTEFSKLNNLNANFDNQIFGTGQAAVNIHKHLSAYLAS